jgi:iron complex transport system ATP-binding protein
MEDGTAASMSNVGLLRGGRWLVRGVSLHIEPGELVAIMGPSGCGKTTLLRLLAGQEFPTEGEVALLGRRLGTYPLYELQKLVRFAGSSQQYDLEPALSVESAILTGFAGTRGLYFQPTVAEVTAARAAAGWAGLETVLQSPLSVLSAGETCRVKLARARVGEVRLMLLDEPTTGLDLVHRDSVHAMFARRGGPAVVWVTHHPEELPAWVDRVLLMSGGSTVVSGPPVEVLTDDNVSRAYGRAVRVVPPPASTGHQGSGWRFELR